MLSRIREIDYVRMPDGGDLFRDRVWGGLLEVCSDWMLVWRHKIYQGILEQEARYKGTGQKFTYLQKIVDLFSSHPKAISDEVRLSTTEVVSAMVYSRSALLQNSNVASNV